jgi:hypothetical protein
VAQEHYTSHPFSAPGHAPLACGIMTDKVLHCGKHPGGHKADNVSVWTATARRAACAMRPVARHSESSRHDGSSRYAQTRDLSGRHSIMQPIDTSILAPSDGLEGPVARSIVTTP